MSCAGWANCNSFTVWGQVKGVAGPQNMSIFRRMHRGAHVCVDVSFDGALKSQRFSSNLQKWRVALRIRHVCRWPTPLGGSLLDLTRCDMWARGKGGRSRRVGDWQHHVPDGKSNITTLRAFQFTCENHFLFFLFFSATWGFSFLLFAIPCKCEARVVDCRKQHLEFECRFAG